MNSLAFNSLDQVERLEKTGFPHEAVAIVHSQQAMFEYAATHILATKADVSQCIAELRIEMTALRAELRHEMIETKTDIIKWVTGLMLAQAAVVSALVKLF